MPFVLRKLDRKAAFYPIDGIPDGDVQADALSDLRTRANALSVWLVDEDRGNLHRIVAALAAGRMQLAKLDYALIDQRALEALDIQVVPKGGLSCDVEANARWHRDILELSGAKLVELAAALQTEAALERVQKSDVRAHIVHSISMGFIDPNGLEETIRVAVSGKHLI